MSRPMIRVACSGALLVCATAVAQTREYTRAGVYDDSSVRRFFHNGDGFTAHWRWPNGSGGDEAGIISVPFNMAGAAIILSDDRVLAVGIDSNAPGACHLCEVYFAPVATGIQPTLSSTQLPQLDLVELYYHQASGLLFGLDAHTSQLLAASYQQGLAIGPWAVAAAPTTCPPLKAPPSFVRFSPLDGTLPGLNVHSEAPFTDSGCDVVLLNGNWICVRPGGNQQPSQHWWTEQSPRVASNHADYEITVGGGTGLFGLVDRDTSAVVFQAVHPGPATSAHTFVVPQASMVYGRVYQIRSLEDQEVGSSIWIRAAPEWRRATMHNEVFSGDVVMRWDFPTIGTDALSWSLEWVGPPGTQPAGTMMVTMVMGDWQWGVDPTVPLSAGTQILALQYGTLPTQIHAWEGRPVISAGYLFDVNNPVLTGTRVALQGLVVLPSLDVLTSDVIGIVLN